MEKLRPAIVFWQIGVLLWARFFLKHACEKICPFSSSLSTTVVVFYEKCCFCACHENYDSSILQARVRAVGAGEWGDGMPCPPPRFGRSLNPISTGGQIVPTRLILAPPPPPFGILDLPMALRATDRSDLRPHQTPAAAIRIYFSGNFHDENLRPANFYHEDYEKCANHRVCERMSCEESKIIADVCRYNP